MSSKLKLPHSTAYSPWNLVRHEGELRLAYVTRLFSMGFPMGQPNGGRGIIMNDAGTKMEGDEIAFREPQMVYEWRNRPTPVQLEKARERERWAA